MPRKGKRSGKYIGSGIDREEVKVLGRGSSSLVRSIELGHYLELPTHAIMGIGGSS